MKDKFLADTLEELETQGLRRSLRVVDGSQGREIVVDGHRVLNFCSNNYLGLADHPRLRQAAVSAIEKFGLGSGASRLVCGNFSLHRQLEEKLARFKGTESAIVFSTGYMANIGIISSLWGRGDMIFSDRLNHASIVDGIRLSQAEFRRYPHRDMHALRQMLEENRNYRKKVIITDTVFSMDGDIALLDKIVALADEFDCMVMVDEAHAVGVLGKNGKGAAEHFGLEKKVDIQMGTLSKAAGSFGAYCCGPKELIDYLVNKARSFIYTTAMPASVVAASLAGIEMIESEPGLREKLWENTRYLLTGLKRMGFDTLESETPIIPVLLKEANIAVEFSKKLFEAGIFVSAIRPPTVPRHSSRLRITVMASHRREDLDCFLRQMKKTGEELCLL